ncbi:DNA-binding PD1-like protein, partial [Trifolium medium]|nr:DNA-binding PD1-like protein [Trifolium medium]
GVGSGGVFQHTPSGFRALSNAHGGSDGSAFSVEVQHGSFSHGGGVSNSIGSSPGAVVPYSSEQPVKKKRGRPRKYGPDVPVSLRLSPMSATANSTPDSEKRPRGRPPGSGRKQQLASL